jgi:hypothetical protein
MSLLTCFNIILKLLAHTSHFAQLFDIVAASSEKTFFISEIGETTPELLVLDAVAPEKTSAMLDHTV